MKEIISGIYEIRNTINGHRYIGSSVDIFRRWRDHKGLLRKNEHHSKHLQNAWNKYGEETFKFSIIENCFSFLLINRERHYMKKLSHEYNNVLPDKNSLGMKHSEESIKKMSENKKGTPAWNKGMKGLYSASDETRKKISESQKGRIVWNKGIKTGKPAWNTGLSVSWNKGKKGLQVAWNKGKPMSEETKRKLSEARKGTKLSDEHKKKISNSLIGNTRTLGHKASEETRQKLSDAHKRRKEKRERVDE